MNHLIIGHFGEVGSALYEIIAQSDNTVAGIDLNSPTVMSGTTEESFKLIEFDFIHICIPDGDKLCQFVYDYYKNYGNERTIVVIHSTVKMGFTRALATVIKRVVYSPIRGRHATMVEDIKRYTKFFATDNSELIDLMIEMYDSIGLESYPIYGYPESLEFAKPFNTTWYFVQITIVQELVILCDRHGLDIDTVVRFVNDTGKLSPDKRKLLPYAEKVGGHCLEPNAELISEVSALARFILERDKIFGTLYPNRRIDTSGK